MKKILVLVLTVVMLALLVACNPNVNTDPTAAPNAGTTQGANTPDTGATTPNNEATTSTTATTTTTTPTQSTTSGIVVTRPEVKLPKASALLAKMIGALSATLEASDDASIIYVYEPNYEYEESWGEEVKGYKSAMFFEVLEASVNSDSENIQAYLKVKVGEAYVELNKLTPEENVVINKNNITSYYEFSITVNGDDVSVKANDENASVNLSELVYGRIAQMVGVEGVEGLETMLENAAILQEIEKDVMILVEKALSNNAEKLPVVSPEYVEHLGNIFTVFGDEIITETKDNATGNTTYSLNLPAAKKLIADLENKTLAGYLEGVYGKNVVGGFASFMATLPDKTVREIVDYAVSLSEGTDVDVKEIYAWIDLYVYSIAGTEIKIEEQISERYNSTLADLLAEFGGVPAEEKAEFIASVKTSFENAAKAIETVSVDELLSSMFIGTSEGFFDAFKEFIDMLDEELTLNYTVDAEGVIIAWNYITSAYTYSYAVNGDKVTFTVIMPNDMVFEGTSDSNGASFVVKEGDETVASGNVTVKEETVGEDTTTTVEIDLRDGENDLLDYTAVYVNGMMTSADVTVRGNVVVDYVVVKEEIYDEYGVLVGYYDKVKPVEEFGPILSLNCTAVYENGVMTSFDAAVKSYVTVGEKIIKTGTYDKDGNLKYNGGIYYKPVKEIGTIFTVDYDDLGDEGEVLKFDMVGDPDSDKFEFDVITFTAKDGKITVEIEGTVFKYDYKYDADTDEWIYTEDESYIKWFTLECGNLGNGEMLKINVHDKTKQNLFGIIGEIEQLTVAENNGAIVITAMNDNELVAKITLSSIDSKTIEIEMGKWVLHDRYWGKEYIDFNGTIKLKVA